MIDIVLKVNQMPIQILLFTFITHPEECINLFYQLQAGTIASSDADAGLSLLLLLQPLTHNVIYNLIVEFIKSQV